MRILISSNSPSTKTGYGNQASLMGRMFQALGHHVDYFGWWGVAGGMLEMGESIIYPRLNHPYGGDSDTIISHSKSDLLVTLQDVWVLTPDFGQRQRVPWIAYTPIDGVPLAGPIKAVLESCPYPMAFTQFGKRVMDEGGLYNADYIYHAIDTAVFAPGSKAEARKALDFDDDIYLVSMVAANSSYPSRKSIPEAIDAFKRFHDDVPNSVLYLHTQLNPPGDGININDVIEMSGIDPTAVKAVNQADYLLGLREEHVVNVYRASDVLLAPSRGEGFGLPIAEAQACGCPVITTNFSAMPEILWNGELVEPVMLDYTRLGMKHSIVTPDAIYEALVTQYEKHPKELNEASQHGVAEVYKNLGVKAVMGEWKQRLDNIASSKPAQKQHVHKWGDTAIVAENGLMIPCIADDCTAGRLKGHGVDKVFPDVFPLAIDGIEIKVDDPDGVSRIVCHEAIHTYHIDQVELNPGDVAFDVGAHAGIISAYLGKKFPGVKIYAFEPSPTNFARLLKTIEANELTNVYPIQGAITGDGRNVWIVANPGSNSGGGSIYTNPYPGYVEVDSFVIEQVMRNMEIYRLALLKIDCEGAEWEILPDALGLVKIDKMCAEFHYNHTPHETDDLVALCQRYTELVGYGLSKVSHELPMSEVLV